MVRLPAVKWERLVDCFSDQYTVCIYYTVYNIVHFCDSFEELDRVSFVPVSSL